LLIVALIVAFMADSYRQRRNQQRNQQRGWQYKMHLAGGNLFLPLESNRCKGLTRRPGKLAEVSQPK
jgi:hypothetical protein